MRLGIRPLIHSWKTSESPHKRDAQVSLREVRYEARTFWAAVAIILAAFVTAKPRMLVCDSENSASYGVIAARRGWAYPIQQRVSAG
jgi:hypothetical protein